MNFISCFVMSTLPVLVSAIIGGIPAEPYAFFALILKNGRIIGGGTIVSNNTIVTAAHSLYDQNTRQWIRSNQINILQGKFSSSVEWR